MYVCLFLYTQIYMWYPLIHIYSSNRTNGFQLKYLSTYLFIFLFVLVTMTLTIWLVDGVWANDTSGWSIWCHLYFSQLTVALASLVLLSMTSGLFTLTAVDVTLLFLFFQLCWQNTSHIWLHLLSEVLLPFNPTFLDLLNCKVFCSLDSLLLLVGVTVKSCLWLDWTVMMTTVQNRDEVLNHSRCGQLQLIMAIVRVVCDWTVLMANFKTDIVCNWRTIERTLTL